MASKGSRPSSRTAAVAGPLTLSYAAQCAASCGSEPGRAGGEAEHDGLVGAARPGRGECVQFGAGPGGAGGPHQLAAELAGGRPQCG